MIETMRCEGYELSKSNFLFEHDSAGQKLEPMEEIQIDVDGEFVAVVVCSLGFRCDEGDGDEGMSVWYNKEV